jgi:cell division protein ZapA
MDGASAEKKPVRLSIYNQTFTLLVAGDPAELERAAHDVDELMTTIARSGNMDSTRVAVLACLHLQDRVHALERERSHFAHKTRELGELLDNIIEET